MKYHPKIKDDCPGIKRPYTFHIKKRKLEDLKEDINLLAGGILIGGLITAIFWLISL